MERINTKPKINRKATVTRYYDLQDTFDELYAKSVQNKEFTSLMPIIASERNIKLAYRQIKANKGSYTPGTDGKTMADIENLTEEEYVSLIQKKLSWYKPKMVRRKDIPKPNGKTRPLGIPCIEDRLVQQCILQVLEPICEAKFNPHSHGFRPNRSAEHAIVECNRLMQKSHCTYVVEFDIKGFFDNVNHRKLMRQLWTLGIRDTKLLQIIKAILHAPILLPDGTVEHPTKGTPQGGIISPLLANVVLNELDWWISSQWQDFYHVMKNPPKPQFRKNGQRILSNEYKVLRKTKLKEMYIVRYADDFRIFCKTRKEAQIIMMAVSMWLKERLKLDVSTEKTRIVNLKKSYSEFLGFKLKLQKKGKKRVADAQMSDKAVKNCTKKLTDQIKLMQRPKDNMKLYKIIWVYNSMVQGIQNYYGIANNVTIGLRKIQRAVMTVMTNRLDITKDGCIFNELLGKRYGKSKQVRYLIGQPLVPIGYCKSRKPMALKAGTNQYTPEGREILAKKVSRSGDPEVLKYLMENPVRNRSIEYNDNRLSLFQAQKGRCAVTQMPLTIGDIHCHHKIPVSQGGTDRYQNLVLLKTDVHTLVHATQERTISKLMAVNNLTTEMLNRLNKLRQQVGNDTITI